MKRGGLTSNRARVVAAIGAGALVLATAGPVGAASDPLAASKKCRKTIAAEMAKLAKNTLKLIDKCHKTQMKAGASRVNCNVINSPEMDPPVLPDFPTGKYESYEAKAQAKIDPSSLTTKCLAGDPALGNYQGEDAFTRILGLMESDVA